MLDGLLAGQAIGLRVEKKKEEREKKKKERGSRRYAISKNKACTTTLISLRTLQLSPPPRANRSRRFKIRSLTEPNSISGWGMGSITGGGKKIEKRDREREKGGSNSGGGGGNSLEARGGGGQRCKLINRVIPRK